MDKTVSLKTFSKFCFKMKTCITCKMAHSNDIVSEDDIYILIIPTWNSFLEKECFEVIIVIHFKLQIYMASLRVIVICKKYLSSYWRSFKTKKKQIVKRLCKTLKKQRREKPRNQTMSLFSNKPWYQIQIELVNKQSSIVYMQAYMHILMDMTRLVSFVLVQLHWN